MGRHFGSTEDFDGGDSVDAMLGERVPTGELCKCLHAQTMPHKLFVKS